MLIPPHLGYRYLVRPCLLVYLIALLRVLVVLFLHLYGWYLTLTDTICLITDHHMRIIQNSTIFLRRFRERFRRVFGCGKGGLHAPGFFWSRGAQSSSSGRTSSSRYSRALDTTLRVSEIVPLTPLISLRRSGVTLLSFCLK